MLMKTVRAGVIEDMNCMTFTVPSVRSSLAASKRSPSRSARTKDLTRRAPEMFSCRTVLRRSSFCCTSAEEAAPSSR